MNSTRTMKRVADTRNVQIKAQSLTIDKETLSSLRKLPKEILKRDLVSQLESYSSTKAKATYVTRNNSIAALDSALTGGKGSSLMILNLVKGVQVPDFFCVTTTAFKRVMEDVIDFKQLDVLCEQWLMLKNKSSKEELFEYALQIRETIQKVKLPGNLVAEIKEAYESMGFSSYPVACRSSATTEDTEEASFAGQHDTFLNQRGFGAVLNSLLQCWASIFTDRAIEYRLTNKIDHRIAYMSVVVQKMIDPDVSGTAFSIELGTSYPGFHIAALYGLGEGLVSGELTSDEWLLDTQSKKTIKQIVGKKDRMYISKSNSSGIELVSVPVNRSSKLCLASESVFHIAEQIQRIQHLYQSLYGYDHIDTEFALSKGKILFLQCRPVVGIQLSNLYTVNRKEAQNAQAIITGKYSLLGAVHGRVNVIRDFDALVRGEVYIKEEDIVVTAKTSNYWNQYLTNVRGIVTVEGSPTAHPMLIGRERGLSVICGCPSTALDILEKLNEKWVTIDGISKSVLVGRQPLQQATTEHLESRFNLVSVEVPLEQDSHLQLLEQMGRIVRYPDSDLWWVHQPNTYLSPAWRNLMLNQYECAFKHVQSVRSSKLAYTLPKCRIDEITGKVASEYLTYDDMVRRDGFLYARMSIKECARLLRRFQKCSNDYLDTCKRFSLHQSKLNWKYYTKAYINLHGALFTHHAFRQYLKESATTCARDLGISQFHFDAYQEHLFMQQNHQEDDIFRSQIDSFAMKLHRSNFRSEDDWRTSLSSELKAEFKSIASNFRLLKTTDVSIELPLTELWSKLNETLARIESGLRATSREDEIHNRLFLEDIHWFPGDEFKEVRLWASLDVQARVQMCNMHHWKVRGNNLIREALLKVAGPEIFNFPTVHAIEQVLLA